jgi:hypothetical protein
VDFFIEPAFHLVRLWQGRGEIKIPYACLNI